MKYRNFHEYVDAKGKIGKVIDNDKSGDHVVKGKGKGDGSDGAKAPKGQKVGQDWTKLGDKKLVVKFDKDGNTTNKGKATIRTAENFAHYELLPLVRESIEQNPLVTEDIVRELKRNGLLGLLVGELLEHKETYQHLASVMGHQDYGPSVCRKLVRAMQEEADIAFADELGDVETDDDEEEVPDNYDTEDGAGVEDDEDFDDEDVDVEGEEGEEELEMDPADPAGPVPQAAPAAAAAPAGPTSPAMRNFQAAMMRRF